MWNWLPSALEKCHFVEAYLVQSEISVRSDSLPFEKTNNFYCFASGAQGIIVSKLYKYKTEIMVPGVNWQETSPLFEGLPVCEMERATLARSSLFATYLEILEYLALDMPFYLLPHLPCLKLVAQKGELFQICAVQKTAWRKDLQVTSFRSVPSPAPLLSNSPEMMELELSIPGSAGIPNTGTASQ